MVQLGIPIPKLIGATQSSSQEDWDQKILVVIFAFGFSIPKGEELSLNWKDQVLKLEIEVF